MYLTPSITTQTFKELHIIYPLSKGIPNQCICSSRLTRTAQVLCGDTENVLLLCCFDLFSLLIFFFFPLLSPYEPEPIPSVLSIYSLLDDNSSAETFHIFISGQMCDQEKHFHEASAFFLK